MEKQAQDLGRYRYIVNYFSKRSKRIDTNGAYLNDLHDLLKAYTEKIDFSDEDIKEKILIYAGFKELEYKIKSLFEKDFAEKLRIMIEEDEINEII